MKSNPIVPLLAALLLSLLPARALFLQVETEKVPVERLATNLRKQIAENPTNATLHARLARLHAMAWSLKSDQVEMDKKDQTPWFGYTDRDHPPTKVSKPGTSAAAEAAMKQLEQAIAEYGKALAIDPAHLPSRVGLGWCLDQAGKKTEALPHYRKALEQAWKQEEREDSVGMDTPWTVEVVDYMLPLLDAEKDADEIARITRYRKVVSEHPRPITPILIPLHAETPLEELVNPQARVTFDLDGSALPRQWGWITPRAAWLVYDSDHSGRITSGLQLFGNVTFWLFWNNGYEALASLDDDRNGELRGDELRHLALWHDPNGNGVSEPGEVQPLAAWGIEALSCRGTPHPTGILFQPRGALLNDGSTRPSYDWIAPGGG